RLGDKKHWEIELLNNSKPVEGVAWNRVEGAGDRLRFRSNYAWDLARLDSAGLRPGDVLEYYLTVTDNFKLNNASHAAVPSGKLRITIVSQEQFTDIITGEMRQAADAILVVYQRQGSTKEVFFQHAADTEKK